MTFIINKVKSEANRCSQTRRATVRLPHCRTAQLSGSVHARNRLQRGGEQLPLLDERLGHPVADRVEELGLRVDLIEPLLRIDPRRSIKVCGIDIET